MDSSRDALSVRGRSKERGPKGDHKGAKDKSKGHSKTLGKKNKVKCWNYDKRGHVKECKSPKRENASDKSLNVGVLENVPQAY